MLATARALGEAIMLAMVAGEHAFDANPLDGLTLLFEPVQPLAATILQEFGGQTTGPIAKTIYAIAAVLLISARAPVVRRLGGQAAAEALRDRRTDGPWRPHSRRHLLRAGAAARPPRESTASWPLVDRVAYGSAGRPGSGCA